VLPFVFPAPPLAFAEPLLLCGPRAHRAPLRVPPHDSSSALHVLVRVSSHAPVPKDVAIMRPPIQCDDSETRTLSCSARLRRHGTQSRKRPRTSIVRARTRFRDSELRRRSRFPPTPRSALPRAGKTNKENPSRPGSLTLCVKSSTAITHSHNPRLHPALPFSYIPVSQSVTKYRRTLNNHRVVCAIAVSSAVRQGGRGALPHTQCDGRETCLTATCCGVQLNADTPSGTPWTTGPYIPHPMLNTDNTEFRSGVSNRYPRGQSQSVQRLSTGWPPGIVRGTPPA